MPKFRLLALLLALAIPYGPAPAGAQTKIVFGTDWLAEAEHGGFWLAT